MDDRLVIGLDFGGTKVAAAVADLSGRWIVSEVVPTEPARGGRFNLARGIELANRLLGGVEGELVAVGASTFGIPTKTGVLLAVAIPGWGELSLGDELSRGLRCGEVRLATDVKAATAAELACGALAGVETGIYVNLGTGLAVGLVCGGEVVTGANGAAGEIGYSLRQVADVDRPADERLLLEQVVSGMGLRATAREVGAGSSAADVFARAAENETFAAALDDFVEELSFHLVNLSVALNPERVVVGGGMVHSWRRIEPKLRRALESSVPFPPELSLGEFPFDAPLVGAVAEAVLAAGGSPVDGRPIRTTATNGPQPGGDRERKPLQVVGADQERKQS